MNSTPSRFYPICAFLILVISSILLVNGCKPSRDASQQAELPQAPGDLKIVCGQGGGFTGAWNGFTVLGDGTVKSWKGAYAEDQPVADGSIPADSLAMLWHHLQQMDFFSLEKEEHANMTALIQVEANEHSHQVLWPPKVGGIEPLETPLDSFYVRCMSMSKSVMDL